jgi:hypothetical protein
MSGPFVQSCHLAFTEKKAKSNIYLSPCTQPDICTPLNTCTHTIESVKKKKILKLKKSKNFFFLQHQSEPHAMHACICVNVSLCPFCFCLSKDFSLSKATSLVRGKVSFNFYSKTFHLFVFVLIQTSQKRLKLSLKTHLRVDWLLFWCYHRCTCLKINSSTAVDKTN